MGRCTYFVTVVDMLIALTESMMYAANTTHTVGEFYNLGPHYTIFCFSPRRTKLYGAASVSPIKEVTFACYTHPAG